MPAATQNFYIEQGATWSQSLLWTDQSSNPINLAGYTARMHVRKKLADTATILTFTTENGRISLGGAAGTINLLLTATDSASLVETKAVYDLELVNGSVVTRLLQGSITVGKEVTR